MQVVQRVRPDDGCEGYAFHSTGKSHISRGQVAGCGVWQVPWTTTSGWSPLTAGGWLSVSSYAANTAGSRAEDVGAAGWISLKNVLLKVSVEGVIDLTPRISIIKADPPTKSGKM